MAERAEKRLARLLTAFRELRGLSKAELGRAIGCTGGQISHYEAAREKPTEHRLDAIILALTLSGGEAAELEYAWAYATTPAAARAIITRPPRSASNNLPPNAIPIVYIPVVGQCPAGDPAMQTDGEYPVGFAEEYVPVAESIVRENPGCFALRIEGDSMVPRYQPGDYVVASPSREIVQGKPAIVQVGDAGEVTCKCWYRTDSIVTLVAENKAYPPRIYDISQVLWAYPVVWEMRRP